MNITELKAKVEAARKSAEESTAELITTAKLEAELFSLTDENILSLNANLALTTNTTTVLNDLSAVCKELVTSQPVISNKTHKNFTWSPSSVWGYGEGISALTGLLNGIQYSSNQHKLGLLSLTGLNAPIVSLVIDAFGSPAYYATNYDALIPAVPYDVQKVLQGVSLLSSMLGVVIDTSLVTEEKFARQFELAELRAERLQAEATLASDLEVEVLDLEV